ncbi:hypothetical protein D4T97_005145 [Siminovitchia acidinfaciens]|uniref:Uncharacterized protein n=2 Tax=Siminovitchia acidinfaciens TaxID=2321395 RepID=A0A429Y445_9BACI|nr:hypothetical protein [Siminovitchia acidinfaciens]RST76171.1 hypothetical protein D4T97_005145 [Siminovitchia acidinfaciens]
MMWKKNIKIYFNDKKVVQMEQPFYLVQNQLFRKSAPALLEAATKFIQEGSKVQEKVLSIIDKAMDTYADQLKNQNLTPEERENLNDRIERMVELSLKKDTEYKQWMGYIVVATVGGVGLFWKAKNSNLLRNVRS